MRAATRTGLGLTCLASLALLGLSVWPGRLNDHGLLMLLAVVFGGMLIGLAALVLAAAPVTSSRVRQSVRGVRWRALPWRELLSIPLVLALAVGLVLADLPLRLGFWMSRPAFEEALASASAVVDAATTMNGRLGLYAVDRRTVDRRGGVFFRTHVGPDGIGPDVMSYGFVHRPNREGTPFGAAHYELFHVTDDWYWFRVSDDW